MRHTPYLYIAAVGLMFAPKPIMAQEDSFRQQYEAFRQQVQGKYVDFRARCNADYAKFMQRAWEEYKVMPVIPRPKDESVPPVVFSDEDKGKVEDKPVVIDEVVAPVSPLPQPVPVAPIYENKEQESEAIDFLFYGTACKVRVPKGGALRLNGLREKALANAWQTLSGETFNNTIRDCLELRIRLQLCDWAYLCLLNAFAEQYVGKGNEATLLTAYLYSQSGYKMRLAMDGGRLLMLYGSRYNVYERPYFIIDGEVFVPFAKDNVESISVCDFSFPKEQALSLELTQSPTLAFMPTQKRSLASRRYPEVKAEVSVNKNLIDFFNTYPTGERDGNFMSRWAVYANTPLEQNVKNTLEPTLRQAISGLGERDAAERLLNWVQTAFTYEYDDKVWGHDRAFFAEETLFYPYCDCEDRAILFTHLVRDLLGLDSLLVYYPGHLAAAVRFTESVSGDYISLNGQRFTICDPTYICAPVGRTMPGMDNQTAKVILLRK